MRERLRRLDDRAERSTRLCAILAAQPAWNDATIVGVFAPLIDEPDIELLRAPEKTVGYPIIQNDALQFIAVSDPATLVRGTRGVRQPPFDPARLIELDRLELILVPGAAFTPRGQRLGRGGGFYDRLLASPERRAQAIGICFDCQVLPELPVEPHDQLVDGVITESGIQFR